MPKSLRQEALDRKFNKTQIANLVDIANKSKETKGCVIEAVKRGIGSGCKRALGNPRFNLESFNNQCMEV